MQTLIDTPSPLQEESTSIPTDSESQTPNPTPFEPYRRIIPDEFIDMSFLQTFTATSLTQDNGVIKYTDPSIQISQEPLPEDKARVRIRFESRTEEGELVEKEKNRKELKAFKLNVDNMILGLHYAVASMRTNEISWFKFTPRYHYGDYAPTDVIKPGSSLYFKVELAGFKNEKKTFNQMTYDEMIVQLNEIKDKGNNFFKEQDFGKAMKEYKKGVDSLSSLPKQFMSELSEEQHAFLKDLKVKLANNAAMSCIKRKEYTEGLKYIEVVLGVDPKNGKALFRKGQCYMETKEFELAVKAFEESMNVDKSAEDECKKNIRICQGSKQTRQRDERKLYSEVFKRMAAEEEREEEAKKLKEKMERRKERERAEKKEEEISVPVEPVAENKGIRIQDLLEGTIINTQGDIKIDVTAAAQE